MAGLAGERQALTPDGGAPTCYSCEAAAGLRELSPGGVILRERYWRVEHAYPCGLRGWLVIVLQRHVAALHELTAAEWAALGALQERVVQALRAEVGCAKEYVAGWAEAPHFQHVHLHVIPVAADLPSDLRGPEVFRLLGPGAPHPVAPDDVRALSAVLAARLAAAAPDPAPPSA